jgi:ABC-type oligopeptide transport system substrate-binding subunit
VIGSRYAALAALAAGAVLVAGCGSTREHASSGESLTYQYLPFDQVDPQRISDGEPFTGQNLLEGLVTPDASGKGVVPATADSWQVSRDGTVYTFHIRQNAKWSDGTPVTARDFEWTYKRLLTPSSSALSNLNGSSSYPSDLGIKNALDYQLGTTTDWSRVGVKARDPSHLRIVLAAPNANFLQEMAQPAMVPLPEKNLTTFRYSWQTPAHWVGNGPFVIKSWTPNSRMVIVPNEHYWDRKAVHLKRVTILMPTATDAQLRRRYQQQKLDIAELSDPRVFTKDPALAKAVTGNAQYAVLFLTLIPSRNPALEDVRVRKAIALGIGRADIAKVSPVVKPSTALVPRTLPGFDASVGFRANVAEARRLLAEAGYPGGRGFPTFIVMTTYDDPYIRAVIRSLRRNLGINAVQDVEDPSVENAKRLEVLPAGRVGYFSTGYSAIQTWRDWVSKLYPPTQTELLSMKPAEYTHYQVLQASGTAKSLAAASQFLAAHASPQARHFAAVTAEADATANRDKAIALYKQAAAIRASTFEFIPFAYGGAPYVIRPGITGVHFWTGYPTISFKDVSVG